jgi:tRNA modification GTPase
MVDTICAISTPPGRAALGLIRISGPAARMVTEQMAGQAELPIRNPYLVTLKNGHGQILDEALVTYFQGPNSYTGEDLVEISAHGNPLILERIVAEIVSRGTIRLAEPGEFTSRALANGKMTVDQVEALDWILNASTMDGVRRGLQSKITGLGHSTQELTERFLAVVAVLQSQLDFSEEEVGDFERGSLLGELREIESRLQSWSSDYDRNRHLYQKRMIVLAGPPNSGKSSLFNRLIGSEKAIVYDEPGTTRDFLEHAIEIQGVEYLFVDTAGIRSTENPIELLGVRRSKELLTKADVICWLSEAGELPPLDLKEAHISKPWVLVRSKADLADTKKGDGADWINVSSLNGDGVKDFIARIRPIGDNSDFNLPTPLTSERQRAIVAASLARIQKAVKLLEQSEYLDMVTEQVLAAAKELNALVDPPENNDVLKHIFARFCIGK